MIVFASLLVAMFLAWVAAFFYLADRWQKKDAERVAASGEIRGVVCPECGVAFLTPNSARLCTECAGKNKRG